MLGECYASMCLMGWMGHRLAWLGSGLCGLTNESPFN